MRIITQKSRLKIFCLLSYLAFFLVYPVTPLFAEEYSGTDENIPSYPATYNQQEEPAVVDSTENVQVDQPGKGLNEASKPIQPQYSIDSNGTQTFSNIQLNYLYTFYNNNQVNITFTKLPQGDNFFSIKEVELMVEGIFSKGYEFNTNMQNYTFEYVMTLPNPFGNNAELKYSEDNISFKDVNANIGNNTITFAGNHFTVFVVTYNSIPSVYPGAFSSLGYAATSTKEFGDQITLAGSFRKLSTIEISLTNWSCENDFSWSGSAWVPNRTSTEACVTTPGSSFTHPITLNIYNVDSSSGTNKVGSLITTKTINANIPFRPSYDAVNCTDPSTNVPFGGKWFDAVRGVCTNGYAFNISYDFSLDNLTLPNNVIITLAYNTSVHGYSPIGMPGPYDSLNVSLATLSPTTGTDTEPGVVFWNTTHAGFYTDSGASGVGILRRDTDWSPFTLAMNVNMFGNEAPVVNIVSPTPLENSYVKGTITSRALATDDYGMGSYYLRYWKDAFESSGNLVFVCQEAPGADLLGTSLDESCEYNTTLTPDGLYVFSAQFLDSNTTWGQALRQFYIDNTKPTVTLTSPLPSSNVFNQTMDLVIDSTDNLALDRIVGNIYKNGTLYRSTSVSISGLSGTHTIDLATVMAGNLPLPAGNYTLKYNAQDKAGNISTTKTFDFTIDITNPSFYVKGSAWGNSYTPFSIGNGNMFKIVSFKLYDANKIDKVSINGVVKDLSNNPWSDLNNVKPGVFGAIEGTNTLVVFDVAGNTTQYEFVLDTTAPSVPTNGLPHNSYLNTNNFYFNWDSSTDNNPGPITYVFQASLSSSQVGGVLNSGVWVNTSSSNPAQNPLNLPQILSVGAPDGTWYWQVKAIDQLGNESNWSEIWNVTLDTVAPTGSISYSITTPTNTSVVATLSTSETVTITNNGASNMFTFDDNGTFTFTFSDLAGNLGSAIATVTNIDKVFPILELQTLTINEGDSAPAIEDFVLNNPENLSLTCTPSVFSPGDLNVDLPNLTKTLDIECSITDEAGNTTTANSQLVINNTLPSVSINANPSTSVLVGTPVTLIADISGNVLAGNTIVSYLWSGACSGNTASVVLNTPSATSYNCNVLVTDSDGDTATSSITVSANNTLPSVIIFATPSTNVSQGTLVTLQGNVLSGDANFSYVWSGACSGSGTLTATGLTNTATVPTTPGSYYCRLDVTDSNSDTASAGVVIVVNNGAVLGIGASWQGNSNQGSNSQEEQNQTDNTLEEESNENGTDESNQSNENAGGNVLGESTTETQTNSWFVPLLCAVLFIVLLLIAIYLGVFKKKQK